MENKEVRDRIHKFHSHLDACSQDIGVSYASGGIATIAKLGRTIVGQKTIEKANRLGRGD